MKQISIFLIEYRKWIYSTCLIINLVMGLYLLYFIPTNGTNDPWVFIMIFSAVSEMFILQLAATIIGFISLRYNKLSILLTTISVFILTATIIRYFI